MDNHTKEPWAAELKRDSAAMTRDPTPYHDITADVLPDRGGVVVDSLNRDHCIDPEEDAANARRIVACVNACAGIPTDALEGLATRRPAVFRLRLLAHEAGYAALLVEKTAAGGAS